MKTKWCLGIISLVLLVLLAMIGIHGAHGEGHFTAGESSGVKDVPGHESRNIVAPAVYTSTCIHRHWEGVILPLDGQPGDVRLQDVTLEAAPGFFSCMVRNFIIHSTVTFTLENSSATDVYSYTLVFPFSTHALYGDHNTFREIQIRVDGTPISFEVALDRTRYELRTSEYGDQLYYKGRLINGYPHPLLADATDLRRLSLPLAQEGFDMVAYWPMDLAPHEQRVVQIQYTSNSDDMSSCCREVYAPTWGREPYYFYFDLSNARYWRQPITVHLSLPDTDSAIWSAVPQLDLQRTCTSTIEFWGAHVSPTMDLAIPAEPDVFGITPRCWPGDEIEQQEFTLQWLGGSYYLTGTEIVKIAGTTGVTIENVELPLYLSDSTPTAHFSVTLNPAQLSEPAYIDVYGAGMGSWGAHLYDIWSRMPITGPTVTGHDLALASLGISGTLDLGAEATITGTVENKGVFDESHVLASLYVNQNHVTSTVLSGLSLGERREFAISWIVSPTMVYFLEVEIEPLPGEVNRGDNALGISVVTPVVYLPLVHKDY